MVIDIGKDKEKQTLVYICIQYSKRIYNIQLYERLRFFFMNTSIFRFYLLDNDCILQLHRSKLENGVKVNIEIEKSTEMAFCLYLINCNQYSF